MASQDIDKLVEDELQIEQEMAQERTMLAYPQAQCQFALQHGTADKAIALPIAAPLVAMASTVPTPMAPAAPAMAAATAPGESLAPAASAMVAPPPQVDGLTRRRCRRKQKPPAAYVAEAARKKAICEGALAAEAWTELTALGADAQRQHVHWTAVRTRKAGDRQPDSFTRRGFYEHMERCYAKDMWGKSESKDKDRTQVP